MEQDVSNTVKSFVEMVPLFEKDLNLRAGLLTQLLQEDDWSFTIKAHALVETALSTMLARVLDERLNDVLGRLELGDAQTGKMKFAQALELIDPDQVKFIRKLSELRNRIVHDVRGIDFTFKEYLAGLDDNQRQALFDGVVSFSTNEARAGWIQNARRNIKGTMWVATVRIVAHAVLKGNLNRIEKQLAKISATILASQTDDPTTEESGGA